MVPEPQPPLEREADLRRWRSVAAAFLAADTPPRRHRVPSPIDRILAAIAVRMLIEHWDADARSKAEDLVADVLRQAGADLARLAKPNPPA